MSMSLQYLNSCFAAQGMKTRRAHMQQLKKVSQSKREKPNKSKRAQRRRDLSQSSSDEEPRARKRQHSTSSISKVKGKGKKVKKESAKPKKYKHAITLKGESSSSKSSSSDKKVRPSRSPRRADLNRKQYPKPLPKKVPRAKSPAKSKTKNPKIKTVTMAGNYPVDQYFPVDNCHILQHGDKVYSATLNMTKIVQNNNKYYIIQAIQKNQGKSCYLWTRWGRVGGKGQSAMLGPTMQQIVITQYEKKFREKHIKGEYRHLEINYNEDSDKDLGDQPANAPKQRAKDIEQSKLSIPVRDLINIIFDSNMMNRQMKQIGYDVEKMPLGKLSKETIRKGYTALKELMQEVLKSHKSQDDSIIQDLNNTFYSYIPHDFGFANMRLFILNTKEKVQKKLELLESLENITVANKILKNNESDTNITDQNYAKLDRDVTSLIRQCREYQIIEEYIINTHAKTHNQFSLRIDGVFKLDRKNQNQRFTSEIHNKMLLWHGSRLTNYAGILSQGLRIAPPEAPVTGYMFGKGVYFADMVSKSANYCFTSRDNTTGLLLLCQVALGDPNEKTQADCYANLLPAGKHSTKGCGKTFPPLDSYVELNGVKVPLGEGVLNQMSTSLLYNEYIVYDVAQIKLKYLVQISFRYY